MGFQRSPTELDGLLAMSAGVSLVIERHLPVAESEESQRGGIGRVPFDRPLQEPDRLWNGGSVPALGTFRRPQIKLIRGQIGRRPRVGSMNLRSRYGRRDLAGGGMGH